MKLNICRQVIEDNGAVDQIIMQRIFLGLPRSGKISTKKRLVGKKPTIKQASTGVAEKVVRVEIEKSIVQPHIWNEVTELNDETALIIDEIVDHNIASTVWKINNENVNQISTDGIIHMQVGKVKALLKRKPRNVSLEHQSSAPSQGSTLPPKQENAILSTDHLRVLSTALQGSTVSIFEHRKMQFTIYISDVGGQPEFQEMLPALVSGPSLYFLTFPLHKGLNERFLVEYQHPNGKSVVPFQDSFTIKEVLLQSLASIASTKSYVRVDDGKPITPKVLFIATHRDKFQSEQQLIEIDQELQEIIKKTAAYKENMIVFYSKKQMVFALDNTSNDDTDIERVRDAVERIGTHDEDYEVMTPCTWLIFSIIIRQLPEKMLSINECMKIGNTCGIATKQELNDALWFIHYNIGIVHHFQEHLDVVIKAAHSLAFACPEPPAHEQSHAATINFFTKEEPCTTTCQRTGKCYDLPDGHMIWFDEDLCLPPKSSSPSQSTSESTDTSTSPSDFPTAFSLPKLHHLDLIEGNGKTVRVIKKAAAEWESVATRLHFDSDDISRIRDDHNKQALKACRTVFIEWLQGKGRKPTTWNVVIKALKEADLSVIATDLEVVLSAY